MKALAKLEIDPRYIFGLLFLMLAVPLLFPIGLPLSAQPEVKQAYDAIEKIKNGGTVLVGFDYSAGAISELEPTAVAVLTHLMKKEIRVVTMTSTEQGTVLADQVLEKTYGAAGKKYGEQYVNLGYFGGGETGLAAVAENTRGTFKKDFRGNDLDSLPLMKDRNTIKDYDMSISLNVGPIGGASTDAWVRQIKVGKQAPLVMGVVAVMGPAAFPYLRSNQMDGLLVGLRAGADYEVLLDYVGPGRKAMDALSMAHVVIIGMILLGNLALYAQRQVRRAARGGGVSG